MAITLAALSRLLVLRVLPLPAMAAPLRVPFRVELGASWPQCGVQRIWSALSCPAELLVADSRFETQVFFLSVFFLFQIIDYRVLLYPQALVLLSKSLDSFYSCSDSRFETQVFLSSCILCIIVTMFSSIPSLSTSF